MADEGEVERREAAAIEKYGRVCYTWGLDSCVPQEILLRAAQHSAPHQNQPAAPCSGLPLLRQLVQRLIT